ncbi:MAG: hypothetical protein QF774_15880 [Nitrospinota bacterium]|nr:hypothetical protein [Nitrospinota bacterium]
MPRRTWSFKRENVLGVLFGLVDIRRARGDVALGHPAHHLAEHLLRLGEIEGQGGIGSLVHFSLHG